MIVGMAIENLAWVLPRPSKSQYIGSFPLHFEKKLLRLLGLHPDGVFRHLILHPFGGKVEFGLRLDILPQVEPDIVGDAHQLPFRDEVFDCVILDPPYTDEHSKRLYNTGKLKFGRYTSEAVRVLKDGGYLVFYHWIATPRIPNTVLVKRILLETRVWHKLRCVHIHRKDVRAWQHETKDWHGATFYPRDHKQTDWRW